MIFLFTLAQRCHSFYLFSEYNHLEQYYSWLLLSPFPTLFSSSKKVLQYVKREPVTTFSNIKSIGPIYSIDYSCTIELQQS